MHCTSLPPLKLSNLSWLGATLHTLHIARVVTGGRHSSGVSLSNRQLAWGESYINLFRRMHGCSTSLIIASTLGSGSATVIGCRRHGASDGRTPDPTAHSNVASMYTTQPGGSVSAPM